MNETSLIVTPEELSAFVQAVSNRHLTGLVSEYPTCEANWETIGVMLGKKYARLVTEFAGRTRSAFAFVDLTNGNILKCDGWSRPAKGPRGNIRNGDAFDLWKGAFTNVGGGLHVAYAR